MMALTRILEWLDARFTADPWVAMPGKKRMRWAVLLSLESLVLLGLLAVVLSGPGVRVYTLVCGVLVCAFFAGLAVSPEKTARIVVRLLVVLIPIGLLAYVVFALVAILAS